MRVNIPHPLKKRNFCVHLPKNTKTRPESSPHVTFAAIWRKPARFGDNLSFFASNGDFLTFLHKTTHFGHKPSLFASSANFLPFWCKTARFVDRPSLFASSGRFLSFWRKTMCFGDKPSSFASNHRNRCHSIRFGVKPCAKMIKPRRPRRIIAPHGFSCLLAQSEGW